MDNIVLENEFKNWAENFFTPGRFNTHTYLNDALNNLKQNTNYTYWSGYWLEKSIEAWCEYKGYIFNPEESLDEIGRCRTSCRSDNKMVCVKIPHKELKEVQDQAYDQRYENDPFAKWASDYFNEKNLNAHHVKHELFQNFEEVTGLKNWASQRFKKELRKWCEFKRYQYNPLEFQDRNGRIVKNIDEKSTEMIYLRG